MDAANGYRIPAEIHHASRTPLATVTAIAILHREEILNRVAAGEYLASISQSLNLAGKGQAISNALANDPEYQVAREFGLEAKLAEREKIVEDCADPRDVPRARELLSHARWRAEREAPHRWGQKSELKVDATISVQLVRFVAEPPEKIVPSEPLDLLAISESAVK